MTIKTMGKEFKGSSKTILRFGLLCGGILILSSLLIYTSIQLKNTRQELAKEQEANSNLRQEYVNLFEITSGMFKEYDDAVDTEKTVKKKYKRLKNQVKGTMETLKELDESNKKLKEENKQMMTDLTKYEERSVLFDKYEYAIYNEMNQRTDITYAQIKEAEEIMTSKNLDTNLLFSIIMTESRGRTYEKSPKSSARGYGQLLRGTAKEVYEDIMKCGYYEHDMAYNGSTNIQIMANYLSYLAKKNNDIWSVIYEYRGEHDVPYVYSVESYLAKAGTSLEEINREYYCSNK